ncbi:hypothetical protein B566_EDAN010102 [Ephemera danica]|nr:hypothetical protein B566_EDAN010102 [Ephemera danica]
MALQSDPGNLALTDIGGKYYYYDKSVLSYFDALQFCRFNGMDLISIETQQEQDAVNVFLKSKGLSGAWVITSGNKIGSRCEYEWENGDTLSYKPLPFTNWLPGEPATRTLEDCLMLVLDKWLDVYCTAVTYFMCEVNSAQTITTTTPCPVDICLIPGCKGTIKERALSLATVPPVTKDPNSLSLVDLGGRKYYLDKTKLVYM